MMTLKHLHPKEKQIRSYLHIEIVHISSLLHSVLTSTIPLTSKIKSGLVKVLVHFNVY